MSSINRKIKRNKKNIMRHVNIEFTLKSLISNERIDIILCSYNSCYFNDYEEPLQRIVSLLTELTFTLSPACNQVFTYADFFNKVIYNDCSAELVDYVIDNEKILHNNELIGINLQKFIVKNYIIYLSREAIFFEDIKTNIKYMYFSKAINKEVA